MSEQSKKVALPAYLVRRCEAFRLVKGEIVSYVLRDKLHGRTFDFDAWQFFILEVLPGCDRLEKLQSVFRDRFDRELAATAVNEFFGFLAENRLLDDTAQQHPLLKPHFTFDAGSEPPPPIQEEQPHETLDADAKVILPPYLVKRVAAYRHEIHGGYEYVVSDKVHGKAYRFEPWQFFILEALGQCDSLSKLQAAFSDRFLRSISKEELDVLFASIADRRLFDESALKHPLLKAFAMKTFEVVDGKAKAKLHSERVVAGVEAAQATAVEQSKAAPKVLAGGIQDVVGMDPEASKRMLPLFDPRPVLRWLVPLLLPLRYLAYALPVLAIVALMLVFKYSTMLAADLRVLHIGRSLIEHLLFAMLTVNLAGVVTLACVAHSYRAQVERFCVTLYLGFIPRFVNRISGVEQLTRRETMSMHGANLMVRAFILFAAVLTWYNTRDQKGDLQEFALSLILTAGASLLLETGNPLVKGSSYFLLSAYLNEPHLRGKSFKALMNKLRAGIYQTADKPVLVIYALAFVTYTFVLVTLVMVGLGQYLLGTLNLGGSAIIVTVAVLLFLFWRNYVNLKRFGDAYERALQFEMWRKRTLLDKGENEGEIKTRKPSYWTRAVLVLLFVALFVPYPYEPAGTFTVFPTRKQVLSTDVAGLIEEVYFDGGETIKQGTVLARLAHDDYKAQVKVYDARILEQRAVIADLKSRPKPEEVKLAEQALEVAKTRELFSREKAPRLDRLQKIGAVTFEEYEAARKDHETDVQEVGQKQAALDLAKVGATPDQVKAAEAKLVALAEERESYVARLGRTIVKMPFDGNLLTLHLKNRVNSYLDKGQPFASVESTGTVTAEVELAESDVQYVRVGTLVRLRPASYFQREFEGKVTLIDRNVTAKSFGSVVKVLVSVDNRDEALKTGMTGEAKLAGPTMPVWEAFSQAIVRFVRVQMWSWIP